MMACSKKDDKQSIAGDTNNDGQIDMGTEDDVEVDEENKGEHLDSFEASTSGKWEAMFTPVEMEGRAIDMANFDLTPTKEELEAMKKEPAYGSESTLLYGRWMYGRTYCCSTSWLLRRSRT